MKLSPQELNTIQFALTVAIQWEQEAIRCQQDEFTHKALPGYAGFNRRSRTTIKRCHALLERLKKETAK